MPSFSVKSMNKLATCDERIQEIKIMVNRNKIQAMLRAEKAKEEETEEIIKETERMPKLVREHVLEQLEKHIIVLEEVKQKAPIQAKEGLENAIERSQENIERFRIEKYI